MIFSILRPFSCPLILALILPHGGLSAGASASPQDETIDVLECERLDKTDPECKNGGCFQKCEGSPKAYCFASWKNGTDGIVEYVMKGCWSVNEDCVNKSQCVQSPSIKHLNFCCCSDPRCNTFVKNVYYPPTSPPTSTESNTEVKKLSNGQLTRTLIYSIVPIIGLAAIIVLVFWMWKRFKRQVYEYRQQLPTVDPIHSMPPSPHPPRPLKLIELRARGRFGSVWKAQLHDEIAAVKIFPLQDKQSWMTEQDIYKLPHVQNHDNILHFIGTERRGDNLNVELWLITEFQQNGSLFEYLKGHTISWVELCKIAETMARGLSFLHDEIPATRALDAKPAVAHRDFKSKNVLIKSDLTAVIADFGLALKFEPGKNPGETHGLVGTRRYMAPEVLEGAISFNRDAFLRIDMYACGLVLWELMSRCTAADMPVGDYQLPFEEEVGQHPTLEDMQELVVINKVRPSIKDHWQKHLGLDALTSTVEECWDHDAEARLSADCVLERVCQLSRTTNTSNLSTSNSVVSSQQPLIINTNQGLPPVSPVVVQTL